MRHQPLNWCASTGWLETDRELSEYVWHAMCKTACNDERGVLRILGTGEHQHFMLMGRLKGSILYTLLDSNDTHRTEIPPSERILCAKIVWICRSVHRIDVVHSTTVIVDWYVQLQKSNFSFHTGDRELCFVFLALALFWIYNCDFTAYTLTQYRWNPMEPQLNPSHRSSQIAPGVCAWCTCK